MDIDMGKWLMILGGIILFAGAFIWFGSKLGLPFGQLPGDIKVSGENYSIYFPIVTSIIISIILTVLINLFVRR